MIETVTMEKSTFASGPQKFEAGTPKIAEAIGFAAAADYLSNLDMEAVHTHIRGLAMYTATELKSVSGITVYGDHSVAEGSGVVSFLHDTIHACRWVCHAYRTPLCPTSTGCVWCEQYQPSLILSLQYTT